MIKLTNYKLFTIILFLFGCAGEEIIEVEETPRIIIPDNKEKNEYVDHNPFYPLKDKIEDLEFKIDQLKRKLRSRR